MYYSFFFSYVKLTALVLMLAWLNKFIFVLSGIPVPSEYMAMLLGSHTLITFILLIPERRNIALRIFNLFFNFFLLGITPFVCKLCYYPHLDNVPNLNYFFSVSWRLADQKVFLPDVDLIVLPVEQNVLSADPVKVDSNLADSIITDKNTYSNFWVSATDFIWDHRIALLVGVGLVVSGGSIWYLITKPVTTVDLAATAEASALTARRAQLAADVSALTASNAALEAHVSSLNVAQADASKVAASILTLSESQNAFVLKFDRIEMSAKQISDTIILKDKVWLNSFLVYGKDGVNHLNVLSSQNNIRFSDVAKNFAQTKNQYTTIKTLFEESLHKIKALHIEYPPIL